jgi:hypothetical protein
MPDSDSYEMSEEQFASILAAMGFFKDLQNEQQFYDELINLCTAKVTNKLCLSVRNTKTIIFAIYNISLEWMDE